MQTIIESYNSAEIFAYVLDEECQKQIMKDIHKNDQATGNPADKELAAEDMTE